MSGKTDKEIIDDVIRKCIEHLIEDGIFDSDSLAFNTDKGKLSIKRSAFPLAYAAVRNFLTAAGALEKESHGEICVSEPYERELTKEFKTRKKQLTLEELIKRQEEQSKRGLEAEEFVLAFEKKRLPALASRIKRISDYDVAAGFDIVSFDAEESTGYDRFIEVKSYIGDTHFYWSENESDTARQKGDKYVLCLVDYTRMNEPGYVPEFIPDPYNVIFSDEQWLVNTASFRIQKV